VTQLNEMEPGKVLEQVLQVKLDEIKERGIVNVVHLNGQKIIACVSKGFITFIAQDQQNYALGLALFGELGFTNMENPSQQTYGYVAVLKRNWLQFIAVQTLKSVGRVLCKLKVQRKMGTEMIEAENQIVNQSHLAPGVVE